MKLEQSFEVTAPLQRVWEALIDVQRVAPCLPGATVTERNDDGSYNGEFKVKIGPTSAAYSGKLNMESVDENSHHATMEAAGTDKRGQGGAKATIHSSVEEIDADTSRVNVSTDYHITGRLARFGRGGMIEEISNRLLRDFATNLQTMLTGDWKVQPRAPRPPSSTTGPPTSDASPEADVGDGDVSVVAPVPARRLRQRSSRSTVPAPQRPTATARRPRSTRRPTNRRSPRRATRAPRVNREIQRTRPRPPRRPTRLGRRATPAPIPTRTRSRRPSRRRHHRAPPPGTRRRHPRRRRHHPRRRPSR